MMSRQIGSVPPRSVLGPHEVVQTPRLCRSEPPLDESLRHRRAEAQTALAAPGKSRTASKLHAAAAAVGTIRFMIPPGSEAKGCRAMKARLPRLANRR